MKDAYRTGNGAVALEIWPRPPSAPSSVNTLA